MGKGIGDATVPGAGPAPRRRAVPERAAAALLDDGRKQEKGRRDQQEKDAAQDHSDDGVDFRGPGDHQPNDTGGEAEQRRRRLSLPWAARLLRWFPMLRRVPARLIGVGFLPEHVRTTDVCRP